MKTHARLPQRGAPSAPVLAPSRGFGEAPVASAGHELGSISVTPGGSGVVQRVRTKAAPRRRIPGPKLYYQRGMQEPVEPQEDEVPDQGGPLVPEEVEGVHGGGFGKQKEGLEEKKEEPEDSLRDAYYETDSDDDEEDPEHVGIQITDPDLGGTGELDSFRRKRGKIYEDKRADVLGPVHEKAWSKKYKRKVSELTEKERAEEWAETQIGEKTRKRLGYIASAIGTEAPRKSGRPVPNIDEIKQANKIKFRLESTHPAVKEAVRDQIDLLRQDPRTSHISYTTRFGAGPAKLVPEDDPTSEYYTPAKKSKKK